MRARLFDLLKKNAPLIFVARETGLSPSEIVKIANQQANEPKQKTASKTRQKQTRSPRLAPVRSSYQVASR